MFRNTLRIVTLFLILGKIAVGQAQNKKENKPDTGIIVMDINAALTINNKETSNYCFCLHRGGAVVDSQFIKKSEVVTTELHKNDIYTLSFHKEGFPDKYVVIDMHAPRKKVKKDYYEIAFEIELNPEHGMQKEEYRDHPVAVFKYDAKSDDWDYSTKYHEEIHHREKKSRK